MPRPPGTRADTVSTVTQAEGLEVAFVHRSALPMQLRRCVFCALTVATHADAVVPAMSTRLLSDTWRTTAIRWAQRLHLTNRWERNCLSGLSRFPWLNRKQRDFLIKATARRRPRVPGMAASQGCVVTNCQFEAVISSGEWPTAARVWQVPDIQPQLIPNSILSFVMNLRPDDGLMLLGNDAAAVEQAASYLRTLLPPADPA